MRRWKLLTSFVLTSMICAFASVEAATLRVAIDDESVEVPLRFVEDTATVDVPDLSRPVLLGAGGGYYVIGSEDGQPWTWQTDEGKITIGGSLDPDPSLIFGGVAFDFGGASAFSFTFILPLAPLISNPSNVSDSFSGSVTNGVVPGGVTVTALAPPPGIPVDGDGITEMEVYTLSDNFGATWKNVGLDLGPSETVAPLGPFNSGVTGTYNEGPIATIPVGGVGAWTHMRADINFMLSGGGDVFTFNGAKVLVPEPGTFSLAILLIGFAFCSRRSSIR